MTLSFYLKTTIHFYDTSRYLSFYFYKDHPDIIISMNSQKIDKNYCFVRNHKDFSVRQPQTKVFSLLFPKTQIPFNIYPSNTPTNSCLSPHLEKQLSQLSHLSLLQRQQYKNDQKMPVKEPNQFLNKKMRLNYIQPEACGVGTCQKGINTLAQKPNEIRVKFSYQTKASESQRLLVKNNWKNSHRFSIKQINKLPDQPKIQQHKSNRNKICSGTFSFTYEPISSIKQKGRILEQMLIQLRVQADRLCSSMKTQGTNECKASAAQTSASAMVGLSQSEMSLSPDWASSKPTLQRNFNLSLADQIPTEKHLGKTIFLNPAPHNFGGIMPSVLNVQHDLNFGNQGLVREWDQLRGLLYEENESNLKESIHCSPDVRTNNLHCQRLQKFGRQIKESSVSYHE